MSNNTQNTFETSLVHSLVELSFKRQSTFVFILLLFTACVQQTDKEETNASDTIQVITTLKTPKVDKVQEVHDEPKATTTQVQRRKLIFTNGPSHEMIELNGKVVIAIRPDSLEIEQLKELDGEEDFYIVADDWIWYNSIMQSKMDTLEIPVKYTDKDTIDLFSTDYRHTIVKDTTFSLYTYFYFDGSNLKRRELFDLIED